MTNEQLQAEANGIARDFGQPRYESMLAVEIQRLAIRFATEEIADMRRTVASSSTLDLVQYAETVGGLGDGEGQRTKEQIYDAQINPLMAQIIAVCKGHKIPIVATFCLDGGDFHCSTVLIQDDFEPSDAQKEMAARLTRNLPLTMITTRDSSGKVIRMDAIV